MIPALESEEHRRCSPQLLAARMRTSTMLMTNPAAHAGGALASQAWLCQPAAPQILTGVLQTQTSLPDGLLLNAQSELAMLPPCPPAAR
mmetsp:Transcript_424/g.1103  ORF Transcript_424/g.1103 Transcript_424/m.1103 type:complete len:89 (-) Transcript_424:961-1227(-)